MTMEEKRDLLKYGAAGKAFIHRNAQAAVTLEEVRDLGISIDAELKAINNKLTGLKGGCGK